MMTMDQDGNTALVNTPTLGGAGEKRSMSFRWHYPVSSSTGIFSEQPGPAATSARSQLIFDGALAAAAQVEHPACVLCKIYLDRRIMTLREAPLLLAAQSYRQVNSDLCRFEDAKAVGGQLQMRRTVGRRPRYSPAKRGGSSGVSVPTAPISSNAGDNSKPQLDVSSLLSLGVDWRCRAATQDMPLTPNS
ncbi:hypothetical protein BKA80DRAFT_17212 [Phyllosticta citrichinensis]